MPHITMCEEEHCFHCKAAASFLYYNNELMKHTIPNKKIIANAATMDNPAPDNDASVKSLGIFL